MLIEFIISDYDKVAENVKEITEYDQFCHP
jgi:hypothetical protein